MNDITRIKKLEEMRKDFVANVSHELKTPVTSIMGYVETLKAGALDHRDKAEQFVDVIIRQTRNLNALIDDLLTLSRIEDGRSRIKMEDFPLSDLLSSAVSLCRQKADDKKSRISRWPCESDGVIKAHPVLLEQAVTNLIENAIKYSPRPEPRSLLKVFLREIWHRLLCRIRDRAFLKKTSAGYSNVFTGWTRPAAAIWAVRDWAWP